MLSFPLTPSYLDDLLELADVPWCCDAFDAAFQRRGWARPATGGEPAVGWLDHWPLGAPDPLSWHVLLGEYPGCSKTDDRSVACDEPECHEDSFLAFPLAYAAIGLTGSGTGEPVDPRELWGDPLPSEGVYKARATREEFLACYDRAAHLLQARLGTPLPTPPPVQSDPPERQISWSRGKSLVSLFLVDNVYNYSQDDWVGIDIRPLSRVFRGEVEARPASPRWA